MVRFSILFMEHNTIKPFLRRLLEFIVQKMLRVLFMNFKLIPFDNYLVIVTSFCHSIVDYIQH